MMLKPLEESLKHKSIRVIIHHTGDNFSRLRFRIKKIRIVDQFSLYLPGFFQNSSMVRWFLIFFFLFAKTCLLYSQPQVFQDPWMKFDHLSKEDGLTSSYILDFLQDHEGFIWIATRDGLNRYDGYSVKQFRNDPNNSGSLSDNLVTCLAEDEDSILWVGTRTGLNYFDPVHENFTLALAANDSANLLIQSHIRAILPDGDFLWVETARGELCKLNRKTGELKIFSHYPPSMVNTYFYHTIVKASNGNLLLGGRYMNLLIFDPDNETFRVIRNDPGDPTKKRDEDVAVYFIDSKGNYWVGGIDGLYTFERETEHFEKFLTISTFSIAEVEPGRLWIGTGSGLFIYDLDSKNFITTRHNDNLPHSLSHNHLNKIYIDKSGNVWIATLDGVDIYRPFKNKFNHIFHVPENENSPVSNHITAVVEDSLNRIWIGSVDGLECFNLHWQKQYHYGAESPKPYHLASNAVSALIVDSENDLWVGQWSGRGFNIVNPEKKLDEAFSLMQGELKTDWYNDILEDKMGGFWLGVWGGQGLYRFDKTSGKFTSDRYNNLYGSFEDPLKSIAFDGHVIWLAKRNQNRFSCFDPVYEKFNTYSKNGYYNYDFFSIDSIHSINQSIYFYTNTGIYEKRGSTTFDFIKSGQNKLIKDQDSLLRAQDHIAVAIGTEVNDLVEDSAGNIWVATCQGLYKTAGDLPVARFHKNDGKSGNMLTDTIYSLAYQPPDIIWMGTQKGLVRFNIHDRSFRNFLNIHEKYLSSHLVKFIFEDSAGLLWIGTTDNGLNCLDKKTGNMVWYTGNREDPSAFWGKEASCMAEDAHGDLWIGGFGLNKLSRETGEITHFTTNDGLADNEIRAILTDRSGNLWISTANGLSCYDLGQNRFASYFKKDGLQENEFSGAACKLSNGWLAFGGKNGLNIFDPAHIRKNETPPPVKLTGFIFLNKIWEPF